MIIANKTIDYIRQFEIYRNWFRSLRK